MTRSDRSDATAAAFPPCDESTPVAPAAQPGRASARRGGRAGTATLPAPVQSSSEATGNPLPLPKPKPEPKPKPKPAAAAAPAVRRSGRPDWRSLPAPHPMLRAVVVVPVKDEAVLLPRCLAALSRQRAADGRPVDPRSFEIILLANNCSDASADIARRFAAAQKRAGGCTVHVVEVDAAAPPCPCRPCPRAADGPGASPAAAGAAALAGRQRPDRQPAARA